MLVHRYAVLKVQPKSHNQMGRFNAAQPRLGLPFDGQHETRTALLGSITENEPRSELVSESPAHVPKDMGGIYKLFSRAERQHQCSNWESPSDSRNRYGSMVGGDSLERR